MLATALLHGAPASADGGFDVRPLVVETGNGEGQLTVDNPNDHRIYLTATLQTWSKDANGLDLLRDSDTAVASPPATWVAPHSSYTIRVAIPAAFGGVERSYRLVIRQIPSREEIAAGRIVFAIAQSLPVFSQPDEPRPGALSAHLLPDGDLQIINDSGRHQRIEGISQDGRVLASGLVTYALAKSTSTVHLNTAAHPGVLEIETRLGQRVVNLQ